MSTLARDPRLAAALEVRTLQTILVVEDEPNQQTLYQMELEDVGWEVLIASHGSQALCFCETKRVDAVVFDPGLPDMDDIAFLELMGSLAHPPPVILYSGLGPRDLQHLDDYVHVILTKSSDLEILNRTIKAAVANGRSG